MHRFLIALITVLFMAVAFAQNPHFIYANSTLNPDASLTVDFKEAGLGSNQNINYVLSADAVATYACQNQGGNFPKDPKKIDQQGTILADGTFSSGKNGQITESLTFGPPAAPSPSFCKGQQTEVLLSVSYTNVVLTDTTNNVSTTAQPRSAIYAVIP
jgi:hypothetical protein